LEELEKRLAEEEEQLDRLATHRDGSLQWGLTMHCLREAALSQYSMEESRPQWYKQARSKKLGLLKERARLRKKRGDVEEEGKREEEAENIDEEIKSITRRMKMHMQDTDKKV